MGKVLVITNRKGGCGKSFTTSSLGVGLVRQGKKTYFHDCVFKGKDENGKTQYAAIRSTTSDFKRDADGSVKKCSFLLTPDDPNRAAVAVFEAPIDALSHQTLCKQG